MHGPCLGELFGSKLTKGRMHYGHAVVESLAREVNAGVRWRRGILLYSLTHLLREGAV